MRTWRNNKSNEKFNVKQFDVLPSQLSQPYYYKVGLWYNAYSKDNGLTKILSNVTAIPVDIGTMIELPENLFNGDAIVISVPILRRFNESIEVDFYKYLENVQKRIYVNTSFYYIPEVTLVGRKLSINYRQIINAYMLPDQTSSANVNTNHRSADYQGSNFVTSSKSFRFTPLGNEKTYFYFPLGRG